MLTQKISPQDFFTLNASLTISPPQKEIYEFTGRIEDENRTEGLGLDNTL